MNAQSFAVLLLAVHIIGGSIALLSAAIALATKKGGSQHKFFGKLYVGGMLGVFLSALPLAVLKTNVFLFLIGIFSFYLVFSGFRFARNRTGQPKIWDWIAVSLMLLSGIGMWVLSYSFYSAENGQWVTLLIFGAIATILGTTDAVTWSKQEATGKKRIARQLTNMMAGTIATVTAVLVVNVATNPVWIAWIAPTVVITPFIFYWNKRTLSTSQ